MSKENVVSAIENGDLSELQHVLEESEWDIESEPLDSIGQTALHIACDNGHLDIVQYLVNKKRCGVTVGNVYGHTPLMLSLIKEHWKMAIFLFEIAPTSVKEKMYTEIYRSRVKRVADSALFESYKNDHNWFVKEKEKWAFFLYVKEKSGDNDYDSISPPHLTPIHIQVALTNKLWKSVLSLLKLVHNRSSHTSLGISYTGFEQLIEVIVYKTEALGVACIRGYIEVVQYYCKTQIITPMQLYRALDIAHSCFNRPIVRYLLTYCDLNTWDSEGNTALHIAVSSESSDNLENMQCLLQSDRCDPNAINKFGCTPLHIVCHRGAIPFLEAIVAEKRCDLNIQDGNGETALHIGVENVEIVKCLLENGHSRCDIYNEKGLTPFHKAIANGNMASVEIMLKYGANILQTSNDEFQNAPIHIACMYSRPDILKVLLVCTNCNPNQQNSKGDTALHIVCRMRSGKEQQFLEVLTSTHRINPTLVNHEGIAPCDVVGNDGNTLLHVACAEGNTPIVKALVKNGANLLTLNHEGIAPIHTACMNSRLESLKVLLRCENCDPNQQNSKGDTALHIVCRMRSGKVLQFLEVLTSIPGMNLTFVNREGLQPFQVVDDEGNTLLHKACAKGNAKMVELLVKNGADVLKPDRNGDAPIHIICKYCNLDILKQFLVCSGCDLNQQNADGDTALHIVCRAKLNAQDKQQYIQELISTPGIEPEIINHAGFTPVELHETNYSVINMINSLLIHKKSSIQAYLKIFVVGNSGNGKSTLIKAVTGS